jgi:hypothetical protein
MPNTLAIFLFPMSSSVIPTADIHGRPKRGPYQSPTITNVESVATITAKY